MKVQAYMYSKAHHIHVAKIVDQTQQTTPENTIKHKMNRTLGCPAWRTEMVG